ncbi:branched-chain amino acid aminotransferase [Halovulum dunhuangense]|uniref:Probable branched-chain-amino-acid aminotransferase n=1 Tax=Halovulum dunhuangense TaxID=1505036 RepID=A0A849L0B0_9RHOB|nr:branched-chain amino acid aminotransferase [Halovulum dunhuangense]NNU79694.1 branched-chain amino acid aminotransferase [Halovulum dunhuangense]
MAIGKTIHTWFDGHWQEGNTPVMGAADHGTWQGTLVFDGARAFEGVMPDLDLHCARIVRSARAMGMDPVMQGPEIAALIAEGVQRFAPGAALYLRPMMWSTEASPALIDAEPGSTRMAICIEDLPLPDFAGLSLTVSPFRRPRQDTALTEAKAACLYPNNARIVRDARARGFHNALSLDLDGHVAETASTNVFMVRDGVVLTPVPNGTFLAGITRARVIGLLRDAGLVVEETSLTVGDFHAAEEIFLTGNASKVMPVTRFEDRDLPIGPVARKARALYWDFAHSSRIAAE